MGVSAHELSAETSPLRLGILLSGGGRTLENLQEQIAYGGLHARIVCVISSRPDAFGVVRAARLGLPVHIVPRTELTDAAFDSRIGSVLSEARVDLVCMAGFNCFWRIPHEFTGRVMNIHPSLLPDFGGRGFFGGRVHAAVLAAGRRTSGCTVHFCDNEYDHGPVILQRSVPVLEGDTVESLAARVFEQECLAYPAAIRRFIEDRNAQPT